MQQQAIELIGLETAILQKKDCAARIEFPRRAERRLYERNTSAEQHARSFAMRKCFGIERNRPRLALAARSIEKRRQIVSRAIARAIVPARGHHRSVERSPVKARPEI